MNNKQGDCWIISSHLMKHPRQQSEPTIYWLVTFTLTSGKNVECYVKARTKIEALEKVKDFDYLVKINYFNGEFKLLP